MTSQSRKKHPTTVPTSPVRATSNTWCRVKSRVGFASALILGLSLPSLTFGQQPPAWSPQPYTAPTTPSVPYNSLRPNATEPAATPRWSKVEGSNSLRSSSYTQALTPEPTISAREGSTSKSQNAIANETATSLVIRQPAPSKTQAPSKIQEHNQLASRLPKTGSQQVSDRESFQPSTPKSLVQLASFEEPAKRPQEAPIQAAKNSQNKQNSQNQQMSLSPSSSSSRREWRQVRPASYQDDAGLPGLPQANPTESKSITPEDVLPNAAKNPSSFDDMPEPPSLSLPPVESPQTKDSLSPSDRTNDREDEEDSDMQLMPRKTPPQRIQRTGVNCDNLRQTVEDADIRTINVDMSPSFVEGYRGTRTNSSKESFVRNAPMREWYGVDGLRVTYGKLIDLAKGKVVIETPEGQQVTYLLNRLSNPDLAYVTEAWGLPTLCALSDGEFAQRQFVETTMTFKASGACHKPLYFEEPQLERYGHEWGPIAQPVISSANFIKNVALLPYKMGIHPVNECQYPLGYYRPGSCAPWTVGPIPISLRGAVMQAGAVTGASLALP